MELFLVVGAMYRVFIVSRRYQRGHLGEQDDQGFSTVLFPAFGGRVMSGFQTAPLYIGSPGRSIKHPHLVAQSVGFTGNIQNDDHRRADSMPVLNEQHARTLPAHLDGPDSPRTCRNA